MKPRLSFLDAQSIVNKSGFSEHLTPVFLLAIRGYYMDTMGKPGVNDMGIYDDAIFVMNMFEGIFAPFNANTDPSKQTPGIATLIPGLHPYRQGMHHIGKPTAYPAFRPATPGEALPVYRSGQEGVFKGIAINIHRGGTTATSSEGCQTLPPAQWAEFQPLVYSEMDKSGQKTISYLLVEWEK